VIMSARRPRALIVEDDPDLLVVLRVNLQAAGFDTALAGDGRTALARIQAERPDVVLLDVMLPGIDGWRVLHELRDREDRVPVVVCSAKRNAEDVARAEALGAAAYVVKPFDIDRVVEAAVEAVGDRFRSQRPTEQFGFPIGLEGLDPA
jgi:DNA-binding response OmpR family regulator